MNLDGNGRVGNGYAIEVGGDGVAMITNYYGCMGGRGINDITSD